MIDKLYKIAEGLNNKFPGGNDPFMIVTRLAEECGEVAAEVNHFEGQGVKLERYGADVLGTFRFGLEIAARYGRSLLNGAVWSKPDEEYPDPGTRKILGRVVAEFDLAAWALLSSLEVDVSDAPCTDAAVGLVLTAKRSAAHAWGVLSRDRMDSAGVCIR